MFTIAQPARNKKLVPPDAVVGRIDEHGTTAIYLTDVAHAVLPVPSPDQKSVAYVTTAGELHVEHNFSDRKLAELQGFVNVLSHGMIAWHSSGEALAVWHTSAGTGFKEGVDAAADGWHQFSNVTLIDLAKNTMHHVVSEHFEIDEMIAVRLRRGELVCYLCDGSEIQVVDKQKATPVSYDGETHCLTAHGSATAWVVHGDSLCVDHHIKHRIFVRRFPFCPSDAKFSPDGKRLVVAGADSLAITDADGDVLFIKQLPGFPMEVAWSPDSLFVAARVMTPDDRFDLCVVRAACGDDPVRSVAIPMDDDGCREGSRSCLLWSSLGHTIAVRIRNGPLHMWQLKTP